MYLGSVRFFKHLILLVLLLAIVIPTALCLSLSAQTRKLKEEVLALSDQVLQVEKEAEAPEKDADSAARAETSELPAYAALYPDLYAACPPGVQTVEKKTIYLTFDDGPSVTTDAVLDTLLEKDIKATFFVVGNQLNNAENQQRLKRMAAEGHSIGIHTQTHDYGKTYASVEAYLDDFYAAWTKVTEITGEAPQIFRFPGGSINAYNQSIYQELAAEMLRRGFRYFDWNVSAQDAVGAKPAATSAILKNATAIGAYPRAIVLMHDSEAKGTTAQALPQIIEQYQKNGFSFAPLTGTIKPIIFTYRE